MYCSRSCKGLARTRDSDARFWTKIDVRGPDECWPWIGRSKHPDGYGKAWYQGRGRPAAQVVWELDHGEPFPEGMEACHTCDNPPCCNPRHIWAGSRAENAADCKAKGRTPTGERSGRRRFPDRYPSGEASYFHDHRWVGEAHAESKLTEEAVREIRRRYIPGVVSQQSLADEFGVSQVLISRILLRKNWTHLDD